MIKYKKCIANYIIPSNIKIMCNNIKHDKLEYESCMKD